MDHTLLQRLYKIDCLSILPQRPADFKAARAFHLKSGRRFYRLPLCSAPPVLRDGGRIIEAQIVKILSLLA